VGRTFSRSSKMALEVQELLLLYSRRGVLEKQRMKEWPRLIQERVNCSNALGKRLRINDFRCHNAKRKERQRRGEDCVTCIVRQTKTVRLFDTRLESTAGLAPINPDANEVPPPHPLEPGRNLSIPYCLLSGGGRRFRTEAGKLLPMALVGL
jgi:hypothetical protein